MKNYSKYFWYSFLCIATLLIASFIFKVVIYLAIAFVLIILSSPIRKWLTKFAFFEKYKWITALCIIAFTSLFFISSFLIFIPLIIVEAKKIYTTDTGAIVSNFEHLFVQLKTYIDTLNLPEYEEYQIQIQEKIISLINIGNIPQLLKNIVGITGDIFVGTFSVLFIFYFSIKDYDKIKTTLLNLLPENKRATVYASLHNARLLFQRYIIGLFFEVIAVSVLTAIGMLIIGSESVLLIAFLAGVLNIIPYVGPLIAAFVCTLLGSYYHLSEDLITVILPVVLKYLIVFTSVQLIDNMLLQPYIYSNSIKAHPLEIFIVLLAAGTAGGITAMIVAIPTYTVLKVFIVELNKT
jgi:predicted PurR-regulated permease PerM